MGDRDGDGIKDDVDKCPDDPEDYDDFEDEDGCPDLDNDKDGIPDERTIAPTSQGPRATTVVPSTRSTIAMATAFRMIVTSAPTIPRTSTA